MKETIIIEVKTKQKNYTVLNKNTKLEIYYVRKLATLKIGGQPRILYLYMISIHF